MDKFKIFDELYDALCVFTDKNALLFKNKIFDLTFADFTSFERFKKQFNFNLCYLSSENIKKQTPLDLLLESNENFHMVCSYQKTNDEYLYYYIYSFKTGENKVVIFKDITSKDKAEAIEKKYLKLENLYNEVKDSTEKYAKLQEHAQNQILKMAIINRISLVIRETNDIKNVLDSALNEIHNLLGSFKTYFSIKDKNCFKIKYSISTNNISVDTITEYEEDIINEIKRKNIVVTSCLKEYLNSKEFLPKGVKRIIIPLYNKNRLLGIIVTLTKQKFQIEDNKEILQSISVQISSSIIQTGLIQQLNKKNKKLEKTLSELKETQMMLINSEKMASIGQLVSGVAHEINTPLAAINSNNLLIEKVLSSGNDLTKTQIDTIRDINNIDIEAANRISNIVKSLKKFVRLDEAEFQKADINNEIDLTLKLINHEIKDNIRIIKNYSELPEVLCSVNMLNQVFMNILVNACHSIKPEKKDGEIKITTSVENNNLIIKIQDNGDGIPQSIQNKIFNVGFTTKKIGLGTGLGLPISKKIIDIHKGSINFNSTEGKGTEFIVSIPVNNK